MSKWEGEVDPGVELEMAACPKYDPGRADCNSCHHARERHGRRDACSDATTDGRCPACKPVGAAPVGDGIECPKCHELEARIEDLIASDLFLADALGQQKTLVLGLASIVLLLHGQKIVTPGVTLKPDEDLAAMAGFIRIDQPFRLSMEITDKPELPAGEPGATT
ncbi:MAG: hypothetical protein WC829_02790 [Hyphomicrobium sp.]|jgi:hypothetical protein